MQLGDTGSEVKEIQEYLKSKGIYNGEINGEFDPLTKQSVIAYQKNIGVEETGIWSDDLKKLEGLKKEEESYINYEVKKGDTLYRIAITYGSTVAKIAQINNIKNPNLIYPGEIFKIPRNGSRTDDTESKETEKKEEPSVVDNKEQKPNEYTIPKLELKETKGTSDIIVDYIPCYVINLNTGRKVEFAISPESVSVSKSGMFEEQTVKGRSSPFQAYAGSSAKEISTTFILWQDYCKEGIAHTVRYLEALVYPHKATVIMSPSALFRLGQFIEIKGIVTSFSVEWRKPYKDGIYSNAEVSITIIETEDKSRYTKEVEDGN